MSLPKLPPKPYDEQKTLSEFNIIGWEATGRTHIDDYEDEEA